jgi:membrane protein insertase Oxa1/YidC/SpoIIIJ
MLHLVAVAVPASQTFGCAQLLYEFARTHAQGTGLSWLFPFVDGHPPIGWGPAASYLVLPVLLVVSQYASQRIISPPNNDPAQQQSQAILKFLPLMIGGLLLVVSCGWLSVAVGC